MDLPGVEIRFCNLLVVACKAEGPSRSLPTVLGAYSNAVKVSGYASLEQPAELLMSHRCIVTCSMAGWPNCRHQKAQINPLGNSTWPSMHQSLGQQHMAIKASNRDSPVRKPGHAAAPAFCNRGSLDLVGPVKLRCSCRPVLLELVPFDSAGCAATLRLQRRSVWHFPAAGLPWPHSCEAALLHIELFASSCPFRSAGTLYHPSQHWHNGAVATIQAAAPEAAAAQRIQGHHPRCQLCFEAWASDGAAGSTQLGEEHPAQTAG